MAKKDETFFFIDARLFFQITKKMRKKTGGMKILFFINKKINKMK